MIRLTVIFDLSTLEVCCVTTTLARVSDYGA